LGKTYHVEYKTNLLQAQWADWAGPIPATNSVMTIRDPIQNSGRLYRLRQFVP
jgi:hypothetical protein